MGRVQRFINSLVRASVQSSTGPCECWADALSAPGPEAGGTRTRPQSEEPTVPPGARPPLFSVLASPPSGRGTRFRAASGPGADDHRRRECEPRVNACHDQTAPSTKAPTVHPVYIYSNATNLTSARPQVGTRSVRSSARRIALGNENAACAYERANICRKKSQFQSILGMLQPLMWHA